MLARTDNDPISLLHVPSFRPVRPMPSLQCPTARQAGREARPPTGLLLGALLSGVAGREKASRATPPAGAGHVRQPGLSGNLPAPPQGPEVLRLEVLFSRVPEVASEQAGALQARRLPAPDMRPLRQGVQARPQGRRLLLAGVQRPSLSAHDRLPTAEQGPLPGPEAEASGRNELSPRAPPRPLSHLCPLRNLGRAPPKNEFRKPRCRACIPGGRGAIYQYMPLLVGADSIHLG
jgi:hypothetical protein